MFKKIWLKGYRNLDEVVLDFSAEQSTYVYGANNQGKTNFLEAIYYLSHIQLPLEDQAQELQDWRSDSECLLGADYEYQGNHYRLYIKIDSDGRKIVLNDQPIRSVRLLAGHPNWIYTSAETIQILLGSPQGRRRKFDRFLSVIDRGYEDLNRTYHRVLKQRNEAIRAGKDYLIWDQQFVKTAGAILLKRWETIRLVNQAFNRFESEYDVGIKNIGIRYCESYLQGKCETQDELEDALQEALIKSEMMDKAKGYTSIGPHRDDYELMSDGQSMAKHCSRGICRLGTMIWEFVDYVLMKENGVHVGGILMDDNLVDLDRGNQERLVYIGEDLGPIVYCTVSSRDKGLFRKLTGLYEMRKGKLERK